MLKITGRAESDVDAHAQPVYGEWTTQAGADQHDDSGRAGADRAAPDRASVEHRPTRTPPSMLRSLELQHVLGRRRSTASTAARSKRSSAICCASAG